VERPSAIGVLDATRAGLFPAGAPFTTSHPRGAGDRGSELCLGDRTATEILATCGGRAFPAGSVVCGPDEFLLMRSLVRALEGPGGADPLRIEETALTLAGRVVRAAALVPTHRAVSMATAASFERDSAEEIRTLLAAHPGRRHRLEALAARVDSTPVRLARAFRRATGTSIHRYLTHVRLHRAIDRLADGCADLSALALELGFTSHSHFTYHFRRSLGVTPRGVRSAASAGELGTIRRRLERCAARERI
jgi:AraC-like DNA-binding protein